MDRRTFVRTGGLSAIALASGACRIRNRAMRTTLLIAGSKTVLPLVAALTEAFAKERPNIDIVAEGGGSTPGLVAVTRGAVDLGMMVRDLQGNEGDDLEIRTVLIAKDAMGIVVHPSNSVSDLKPEIIRGIFEGRITRWEEVAGAGKGPINLASRKAKAAGLKGFEDLVLTGKEVHRSATRYGSPDELRRAVSTDPAAIGFLALNDFQPTVKAVKVSGVAMSREAILIDRFPYSRPFFLAMNGQPRAAVKEFVDFCTSVTGQEIVSSRDLVRVY